MKIRLIISVVIVSFFIVISTTKAHSFSRDELFEVGLKLAEIEAKKEGEKYTLESLKKQTHSYSVSFLQGFSHYARQEYLLAKKYLEKGCAQGSFRACSRLTVMYKLGKGVDINNKKIIYYYNKACEFGDMSSCFDLGVVYKSGLLKEVSNLIMSEAYFEKACRVTLGDACVAVANIKVGQKKYAEAVKYYSLACQKNIAGACFRKKLYAKKKQKAN